MAKKTVMIADDLAERSAQGRLRSLLLRDSAIEIAKKLKLEIDLLYVKNLNASLLNKKQVQALEESFDDISNAALSQFKKSGVKGRIHLRTGTPADEILNFATISEAPQFMVLGTHGKKGFTKMILGSVAEEVLRHAKLPVMVLGPAAQDKQSSLKITKDSKILLLTDLSVSSTAAEDFALQMSQDFDCPVTALHSVGEQIMKTRTTLYGSGYVPFDMDKMFAELNDDARKSLTRKVTGWQEKGYPVTALLNIQEEPVEKTVLSHIRKGGYTCVVMGTHGRNKFLTAFLGSSARKAILSSPVPVFVVRGKK